MPCQKFSITPNFVVVLFILAPAAHGQGVALAAMADVPRLTTQSFVDYTPEKEPKGLCTVTTVGLVAIGSSTVAMIGGVLLIFGNDGSGSQNVNGNNGDLGLDLLVGGFVVLGAGVCMTVGGGIHDISRHHKYKHNISLIAPRKNQVGFVYNF